MNWLDIVIFTLLTITALIGLKMGLIKSIIPLGGIMLGIFLAGQYYNPLAEQLSSITHNESHTKLAAFAIIFIAVLVATSIITSLINGILRWLSLSWIDRLGGLSFGLAMGSLISATILTALYMFPVSAIEPTVHNSKVSAFFLDHYPFILGLLPKEFDSIQQLFG